MVISRSKSNSVRQSVANGQRRPFLASDRESGTIQKFTRLPLPLLLPVMQILECVDPKSTSAPY